MPTDIIEDPIREEVCRGCLTYVIAENIKEQLKDTELVPGDLQCGINPTIDGVPCPCSECLVKIMCDTACSKLDDYATLRMTGRPFSK